MQEFFINQNSINPVLEMELINDGRYDYQKSLINESIQDSVVTFSMVDEETGILKVANQEANIILSNEPGCEEKYILQYKWKPRDVQKKGFYTGRFEIKFNGDITSDGKTYQEGNLIVPIEEELRIVVK